MLVRLLAPLLLASAVLGGFNPPSEGKSKDSPSSARTRMLPYEPPPNLCDEAFSQPNPEASNPRHQVPMHQDSSEVRRSPSLVTLLPYPLSSRLPVHPIIPTPGTPNRNHLPWSTNPQLHNTQDAVRVYHEAMNAQTSGGRAMRRPATASTALSRSRCAGDWDGNATGRTRAWICGSLRTR